MAGNPDPNTEGLGARTAALEMLRAALARRSGLEDALASGVFTDLDKRDRAHARALAMATLRHLGVIDRALDAKLAKAPPDAVRDILRLGAAQLFYLGTAAHAAVSTAVDLTENTKGLRGFKGLVNAVLRGLQRDGTPSDDPELLAPGWLFTRWSAAYGADAARDMAAMIAVEPATDLTPSNAGDAEALAAALDGEVLSGPTVRTARRGDLTEWPGYAEAQWWVQDASSAVPARLLAVQPGETALDMCAAPGGKTMQLAAAGAMVTALDRSAARLKRLEENLARLSLAAETHAADAATWPDERQFDAVLLDAPCTSTGAYRRHPDALWTTRPPDIAGLAGSQAKLLTSAATRVKPGGRLVYCTCSLEPEEGEAQVETFLAAHPDFRLDPIQPGEGGSPEPSLTPRGWLRILPHHRPGGTDGFFAARLVRLPA
ncbi:MAG: RsmB/NOP family class I SAM-dependent RNA methyltransferase [Caulobacteraceae bacterium]